MRKIWKWLALALIAAMGAGYAALYTPDLDAAYLKGKYANAESEFIETAPGMMVHARDQGPADAPVLVLLHGSSSSLHTWEPWVQRLSATYRIITLDLPGHGLTGPHPGEDYSADAMMAAVDGVLRAKGVERFVLGGNSMGGWIAWRYALANPARVQGLVLVDAAGLDPAPDSRAKVNLPLGFRLMRVPVLRDVLRNLTPRSLVEEGLRKSIRKQEIASPAMVDRYWELLRYPGNRRATAQRAAVSRQPEMADRLGEISAPTLILWGRHDQLIPVEVGEAFSRALPLAQLFVYEQAGHLPQEEVPDLTARDVAAFIGGLDLKPAGPEAIQTAPEPVPAPAEQ